LVLASNAAAATRCASKAVAVGCSLYFGQ